MGGEFTVFRNSPPIMGGEFRKTLHFPPHDGVGHKIFPPHRGGGTNHEKRVPPPRWGVTFFRVPPHDGVEIFSVPPHRGGGIIIPPPV